MLARGRGPSPLWYATRGSGVVTLVLLTAAVCLGILTTVRWRTDRLPRFVVAGLHRNLTLLAVAFLAVHVATAIADGFAPIGLRDAVVPFLSPYRPLWLGLGTLACDLLIAVVLTSLLRARLGLPDVARDALARVRVVAARARALARHRERRALRLDGGARARVRRRRARVGARPRLARRRRARAAARRGPRGRRDRLRAAALVPGRARRSTGGPRAPARRARSSRRARRVAVARAARPDAPAQRSPGA